MSEALAFTVASASTATGISTDTLHKAIRSGDLVATKPVIDGREINVYSISRADLERWLTNATTREASQ